MAANIREEDVITVTLPSDYPYPIASYSLYYIDYLPKLINQGTISTNQSFTLSINNKQALYYLKLNHDLLTLFDGSSSTVRLDERVTVATIFALINFIHVSNCCDLISILKDDRLGIAYGMRNNLVGDDGMISSVISNSPNGLETNSYSLLNFLANILYYVLRNCKLRRRFYHLTSSNRPLNGFILLARQPFTAVHQLYKIFSETEPIYSPSLQETVLPPWKKQVINAWTLTIKFNSSGSKNFIPGGPGYLTFDRNDKVWINNNVRQGTPNSSTFCTILESNGQPSKISPLFGGGVLGAGFGIASTSDGRTISIGNFGWGTTDHNPQEGSISTFRYNGDSISPSNGSIKGEFKRAQGIFYDGDDNLWITGWGSQLPLGSSTNDSTFDFANANSSITVYLKGDSNSFHTYFFDNPYFGTFDVTVNRLGDVYVSNSGNLDQNVKSSLYHFRLINDKIVKINHYNSDKVEVFRQVTIDSNYRIYVAAFSTSRVRIFNRDLNPIGSFSNKIDGPWGLTFDSKDTLFVANFRADQERANHKTFDLRGAFGVTMIENLNDSTAKLLTLPTGGDPITLHNGFPLYGSNSLASFEPLMRLTGSNIDRAGNLWCVNNWKPALINDFEGNPGGDGVAVFLGIAELKN